MTHVKLKREIFSDESGKSSKSVITQIEIKNHAGYDESGYDIVCAAVSSAAELMMNTLTENFKCECDIKIVGEPPEIIIKIPGSEFAEEKKSFAVIGLLESFAVHMKNMERDYPKNLRVIVL